MAGQRMAILDSGTPHAVGDYTLGGNWGTAPSVSSVTAEDRGGRVTITSGSGTPGANPTVTLKFRDGLYPTAPTVVVCKGGTVGDWAVTSVAVDQVVFTFVGTPAVSTAFTFQFATIDNG